MLAVGPPRTYKTFQLYASVVRWYDGDSFYGVIDQGFYSYMGTPERPVSVRVFGIQAPELRAPGGAEALMMARILAPEGLEYRVVSLKPPGLGAGFAIGARPVLDLILSDGTPFREAMIAAGHAVPETRKAAHG